MSITHFKHIFCLMCAQKDPGSEQVSDLLDCNQMIILRNGTWMSMDSAGRTSDGPSVHALLRWSFILRFMVALIRDFYAFLYEFYIIFNTESNCIQPQLLLSIGRGIQ